MVASSGERTGTAVAIEWYVRAVSKGLTSQKRGLCLVVGNGDGGKPLGSGLGIFGMRSDVGLMRWTGVALMQGEVVVVDRERDKDGPGGRDSIWGGVSRAAMRKGEAHDPTSERD
jgi:hypothetical protein